MNPSALHSGRILDQVQQQVIAAALPNISSRYIQEFFARNHAALAALVRPGLAQLVAGQERGWLFTDREELIRALNAVLLAADTQAEAWATIGVGIRAGAHPGQVELRATNGYMAARAKLRAAGDVERAELGKAMFTREDAAKLVKLLGKDVTEIVGLRGWVEGGHADLQLYGRTIRPFALHRKPVSVVDQFDEVWPRFDKGARVRVVVDREDLLLKLRSQEHWVPKKEDGFVRIGRKVGARLLTLRVSGAPSAVELPVEGERREGEEFGLNLDYWKRALRSFTAERLEIAQEYWPKGKKKAQVLAPVRILSVAGGEAESEWVEMPVRLG